MALRHRSRHLHATIFNKVRADLTTLGWVNAPVNFNSDPVTFVDYQPDERQEAIRTNTVAVSLGDVTGDTDEELGALVGGTRSAHYPVFIDVYMAEQALSQAICDDIRDTFDSAIFPLVNQITGADTDQQIEIELLLGPDRPQGGNAADPFKRYWRVMRLGVRLYYQTGPAGPVTQNVTSTVSANVSAAAEATRGRAAASGLDGSLVITPAAIRAGAGDVAISALATVAPVASRATNAASTTTVSATVTASASVATSGPVFDASSPAMASSLYQGSSPSQAYSSNSFSPPAQSLIVVVLSATQSYINTWNAPAVTDSLGSHLTWHIAATQDDVSVYAGGSSAVWIAWAHCPDAQTDMTVTATYSVTPANQLITQSTVAPYVFTNPDATTPIGTTITGVTAGSAVTADITPSASTSALLIAASDSAANQNALIAGAGEYLVSEFHGSNPSIALAWYGTSTGPTLTGSAQTLTFTATSTSRTQWVAFEIRGGSSIGAQSYTADGNASISASVLSAAIVQGPTIGGGGAVTATATKRADGGFTLTGGASTAPISAPPAGARFSTGQDVAYLQGPSSPPAGAIVVNPGAPVGSTVDALTQANPAGTTFWLAPGRHLLADGANPGQFDQIIPKAGNTYIGAPGAYIDGQGVNRYATTGTAAGVTLQTLRITNFVCLIDEFTVNHDTADNFTVTGCQIDHNHGAGVGLGSGASLTYSWLHDMQQYGFSSYHAPRTDAGATPGLGANGNSIQFVTIDHCEITGNGTWSDEVDPVTGNYTGNGRNGGGKFWDTYGITVTNCWVHHNNYVGLWADTNNAVCLWADNLVEYNDAEGLMYEISYNFKITRNTLRGNNLRRGVKDRGDSFPRVAIYISESGGNPAVSGTYATSEISNNVFLDNWDDLCIWESADRFCNSPANTSSKFYKPLGADLAKCNKPTATTLTCNTTAGSPNVTVTSGTFETTDEGRPISGSGIPAGTKVREPLPSNGFAAGYVDATHLVMNANATATATGVTLTLAASTITGADYGTCRWQSANIDVHHNSFSHNAVRSSNGADMTGYRNGRIAIISQFGTYPTWSPYQGTAIQDVIATTRGNSFHDNTYRGGFAWEAKATSPYLTAAQWQAVPQDATGSSFDPTEPA